MSKYNEFAKRLDEAFKAARGEYNAAMDEVAACEQAISRAKSMTTEEYAGEKMAKLRRAELALLEAKDNMNKAHIRVWDGFDSTVKTLKQELAEAIRQNNLANPDAVDNNTLELLKSGILTPDDCASLLDKYSDNATMTRLIFQYAEGKAKELAKDTGSPSANAARMGFVSIGIRSKDGTTAISRKFDELCDVANICSQGHKNRPMSGASHIRTMCGKWEELAGHAIENF